MNYDTENWMALIKQLNETPTAVHVLNRAQLIDDSFTLARAGQLNYSVPLHLSKYLKKENNTIPWYSAKNGFSYLIARMPRSEKGYGDFKVDQTYTNITSTFSLAFCLRVVLNDRFGFLFMKNFV